MSKRSNDKCGPGEIERKGFHRRGYERKEFTRRDGSVVPATYVSETFVPPTCIKDVGGPGYGPKTLPPLDDELHLSKYGYSVHKPDSERRAALVAATKEFPTLKVLRRLNLIRNYQAVPENKDTFAEDVEFMSNYYDKEKERRGGISTRSRSSGQSRDGRRRKSGQSRGSSKKSSQRGGQGSLLQDPMTPMDVDTSDVVISTVDLPEPRVEVNTIIDRTKVCDSEGKCGVRNVVYEAHIVNGKQLVFYTLTEKDVDAVLELDRQYYDSDEDRATALQKIRDNRGLLIGIKINDKLEGYCHYEPTSENMVKIIWFCANKSFGTPLYQFMERYFKRDGYTRVTLVVSLEGSYARDRLNFWNKHGFTTYEVLPNDRKLLMDKRIIKPSQ